MSSTIADWQSLLPIVVSSDTRRDDPQCDFWEATRCEHRVWTLAAIAFLVRSSSLAVEAPKKPKGIFSSLKVGEPVTLTDHGAEYSITFLDEGLPLTHKVVEVGDDFVVVRDIAGVTDTVIPAYSLNRHCEDADEVEVTSSLKMKASWVTLLAEVLRAYSENHNAAEKNC